MPVGTMVVSSLKIMGAMNTIVGFTKNIQDAKKKLIQIRDSRMQEIWKSVKNVDSNTFKQRLQELDVDIQKMLVCLDEYVQLLKKSAAEYEQTQQNVNSNAGALRSPTNF